MSSFLVSHHPPISAFYLRNEDVHVSGSSGQKTSFTGTAIKAEQTGSIYLYLSARDEEYAISLPELHVRGLMTGAPFIELTGEVIIISTSGLASQIKFLTKPWFGGQYDLMEGRIVKESETVAEIWGRWSECVYFKRNDQEDVLFDVKVVDRDELPLVKPLSEQNELESRRVWHPVTKALRTGNYEQANTAKLFIEETQRKKRKSGLETKSFRVAPLRLHPLPK